MIAYSIVLLVLAAVVAAAVMDLLTMTIPNKISLVLIGAFVAFALITQMPIIDFAKHLGAGALILVITFLLFSQGWIGGGDAKFAASVAVWTGFELLADFLLLSALLGGPLTLIFIILKNSPLPPMLYSQPWIARLHDKESGVPYGLALAPAGAWAFLHLPFIEKVMFS